MQSQQVPQTAPEDTTDLGHSDGILKRGVRSFVLRAGRVGPGQQRALDEFGPRYLVDYAPDRRFDFAALFGNANPVIFEIGFGMGTSTAQIAQTLADTNTLGCEVHLPGVGALLKLVGEQGIGNVRIARHDAIEVLRDMVPDASLGAIHVFFPDPWHKKKHNKRRLIQPPFVALAASKLAPGGRLHCATDWQEYAEQMLEVLSAEPALQNTADGYAPKPDYRPLTKFENRGLKLGHGVWDLVFSKR
ncbi:tRNA (guanosine(46)-N7)-methyltransferase TrmB [Derxia lacustris]|uniref:tRNA (guanosine(46)-N7)-methyltransferase TrmB n=1 Tax=Derxia lacustris TaxID=764842 RepID=UPI000A174689|nr:tRNA (guanosine(46)-N7)-methyltransferase TrmB [Derxia lacustris]